MALFGNVGDDYTRTGKGTLGRWSNTFSFLPSFLRNFKIPFIGAPITAVLGYVDTIIEAGQWLFRGQIGSAATVAVAGVVGTTVNLASDVTPIYWANLASGAATGVNVATHARAAVEAGIRALGMNPTVLSSYPAGIGGIGGGAAQAGPGKFASAVSDERGKNRDEDYARYARGEGGPHINELQSALGKA